MTVLRILHLYPHELGINGDVGNVLALVRRAEWRGHTVEVTQRGRGEAMPESCDLVFIGSGQASAQRAVQPDLMTIAPLLRDWAADGVPMLAITAGWQLFGSELELADGTVLEGVGVLPSRARLVKGRANGEFTAVDASGALVAGYENHSAVTTLGDGAEPIATVGHGHGNAGPGSIATGATRFEGVRDGVRLGTSVHGPFLPMNPSFADQLLADALARHDAELGVGNDELAWADLTAANARAAIVSRVGTGELRV